MDVNEYRAKGKEMVDFIADYLETVRERQVYPDVSPGFMRALVPNEPPSDSEDWATIFGDIERVIMPGLVHWQSPHMHAFFPTLNSYPSLLGDMLASGLLCHNPTWASNPSGTELEVIVMDWLAKMMDLPPVFLHQTKGSNGGGVIQNSATASTLISMLAARNDTVKRYRSIQPEFSEADITGRLVAYCSDQAHSSVEKTAKVALVKLRLLATDKDFSLRGNSLKEAITVDKTQGLIPFFVCATLGTTGICAFDNLEELGQVCEGEQMWLHVDAAYAGAALVCPEFRHFAKGLEFVHSFAFNPSKWLMVHFPCSAMWVKDRQALHRTLEVQPLYLKHKNCGTTDFMHWQLPVTKGFNALKLWFVIRSFGVKGLQNHVRKSVELAKYFEQMVRADRRFEIPAKRHLGLVVFRLKGENSLTEKLLSRLSKSGKLYVVSACINDKCVIRFVVTSQFTSSEDIEQDWVFIKTTTDDLLAEEEL